MLFTISLQFATVASAMTLSIPRHSLLHRLSLNSSALRLPPPSLSKGLLRQWPDIPANIEINDNLVATILEYGDYSTRRDHVVMVAAALETIEDEVFHGHPPSGESPIYLRCGIASFFLEILGEPWPNIKTDIARLIDTLTLITRMNGAAMGISKAQLQLVSHDSPPSVPEVVAQFVLELDV